MSVFTCTFNTLVHIAGKVCVNSEKEKKADISLRDATYPQQHLRLKPDDQQISHSALCGGGPSLLLTATIFNIYSGICIYLIIFVSFL